MPGKRNDELITNLNGEFQYRYEPNFAISQSLSQHLNIHGLRAYWPLSMIDATPAYPDVSSQGRILTIFNNVYTREWGVSQPHVGCAYFDGASDLYRADVGFDVVGNEAYFRSNYWGLTLGGWFKFTNAAAANEGLMGKYDGGAANDKAYLLFRTAAGTLRFVVTTDGATDVFTTTTATYAAGVSYHIVARYYPSNELAILVDGIKVASNAVGIPATLWTSATSFAIGAYSNGGVATGFYTGRARDCFVSANYLEDVYIKMLYQQTRAMFGA